MDGQFNFKYKYKNTWADRQNASYVGILTYFHIRCVRLSLQESPFIHPSVWPPKTATLRLLLELNTNRHLILSPNNTMEIRCLSFPPRLLLPSWVFSLLVWTRVEADVQTGKLVMSRSLYGIRTIQTLVIRFFLSFCFLLKSSNQYDHGHCRCGGVKWGPPLLVMSL